MEVHQPLDFSNNAAMSSLLGRHSPPSDHMAHEKTVSVLDLCVRRNERGSPMLSSPSPRSPGSPQDYHPYLNNNKSSINHNDVDYHQHQQLLLRAHLKVEQPAYAMMDVQDAVDVKPLMSPTSPGLLPGMPVLSVLQHQLLPRSPNGSAFGPAPRRRRTSSGLPESPPGSSADDRSSTAASPDLGPATSPADVHQPMATSLDLLVGPAPCSNGVPALVGSNAIPQQVMAASSGRNGKPTRPFKAYPKDPLSLTASVNASVPGVSAAEAALGRASNEAYAEFRRRMLAQVQAATGNKSPSQKRPVSPTSPTQSHQSADSCGASSPPHHPLHQAHLQDAADSNCSSSGNSSSPESSSNCAGAGGANGAQGQTSAGKDAKDAAYWERRRKNNEAAKRSRDARRAKEDEIAIRAAFLEQENLKLKYEVAALRNETAKLRCLLYSGSN